MSTAVVDQDPNADYTSLFAENGIPLVPISNYDIIYKGGLVSFYEFSEGSGVALNDQIGGNTATIQEGSWDALTGSVQFLGTDVNSGIFTNFNPYASNNWELMVLAKSTDTSGATGSSGQRTLMGQLSYDSTVNGCAVLAYPPGNQSVIYGIGAGENAAVGSYNPLLWNILYFSCSTVGQTTTLSFYDHNSNLIQSVSGGAINPYPANMVIGGNGSTPAYNSWLGKIGAAGVWSSPLTTQQRIRTSAGVLSLKRLITLGT